jgi:DNA-binding CsgD family transcriptional regulator
MNAAKEIAGRFHSKLTSREIDVLSLVAEGLSSKEIAQRLEIAPSTVESHLESAKSKLGARSRPNLVARAIAYGLVHPLIEINGSMANHDSAAGLPSTPLIREVERTERASPLAAIEPGLVGP